MGQNKLRFFVFVAIAALALVGIFYFPKMRASKSPEKQAAAQPEKALAIIDAHLHTRFSGKANRFSGINYTEESLIREMKDNGIVGAVSLSHDWKEENKAVPNQKIIQCAGIRDKVEDKARLEADLAKGRYRCLKIYLGYVRQFADHPNYQVVYQLARKHKVPVVFHTGDTSDSDALLKYTDPVQIDELAVLNRDITFVIAHLGNPWVESAAEVVYKNENVYADISAFLVGDGTKIADDRWDEYAIKPVKWAFGFIEDPTKLMFGSDWPLVDMKSYIKAMKKAIPEEHWQDVFYNNAMRVYKIPDLPPATGAER